MSPEDWLDVEYFFDKIIEENSNIKYNSIKSEKIRELFESRYPVSTDVEYDDVSDTYRSTYGNLVAGQLYQMTYEVWKSAFSEMDNLSNETQ